LLLELGMTKRFKRFWAKVSKFSTKIRRGYRRWDPVCGMQASGEFFMTTYRGVRYFFCSEPCQIKFEANPASFAQQNNV
ncbi:MAG TPA: YHS domain-containing protein, partial [Patescibacteria group bacterium]|nr:YHS domain-containing protein [Patescibacteria group bacterium]